jgi:hypothetical protein
MVLTTISISGMIEHMNHYETETRPENSDQLRPERRSALGKSVLRAAAAAGCAGLVCLTAAVAGAGMYDRLSSAENSEPSYDYSEKTATYIAKPGDGAVEAAKRVVGINDVDSRYVVDHIEKMDENKATFEDGVLNVGEAVVYPESVKP